MNDAHLIEIPLTSEPIFNGNFISVYRDQVQLPDGKLANREYVKHSGAVAIIAIDDEDNLVLERQFRHPVGQVILEIPAGKLDPLEDDLTCGRRELVEETGYVARSWHLLGECLPCIGYSTERISYFLAQGLSYTQARLDEGEFLEVIKLPFVEVLELAYSGQIKDSKTLAGIMLYLGYRNRPI